MFKRVFGIFLAVTLLTLAAPTALATETNAALSNTENTYNVALGKPVRFTGYTWGGTNPTPAHYTDGELNDYTTTAFHQGYIEIDLGDYYKITDIELVSSNLIDLGTNITGDLWVLGSIKSFTSDRFSAPSEELVLLGETQPLSGSNEVNRITPITTDYYRYIYIGPKDNSTGSADVCEVRVLTDGDTTSYKPLKNIALNKPVKLLTGAITEPGSYPLSNLNNGVILPTGTPASSPAGTTCVISYESLMIQIDLLNTFKIDSVVLTGRSEWNQDLAFKGMSEVTILGSVDDTSDKAKMTVLGKSPVYADWNALSSAGNKYTIDLSGIDTSRYRYIIIDTTEKAEKHFAVQECEVFSSQELNFGQWSFIPSGNGITASLVADNISTDPSDCLMIGAAYDSNGELTAIKAEPKTVNVEPGVRLSTTIECIETPVKVIAMIVRSMGDFRQLVDTGIWPENPKFSAEEASVTPLSLDDAINSSVDETGNAVISVNFASRYGFLNRHRVSLAVLCEGASFSEEENPSSIIYAASPGRLAVSSSGDNVQTFNIHLQDYGRYPICVTVFDEFLNTAATWNGLLRYDSPEYIASLLSVYNSNMTSAVFCQKTKEYLDDGALNIPGLPDTLSDLEALAPYFVKIRQGCLEGLMTSKFTSFTSVKQIEDAIFAAHCLRLLEEGDSSAAAALSQNAPKVWDKVFRTDISFDNFCDLYNYEDGTITNILSSMRQAIAFSYIMNGTFGSVEKALSYYPDVFGIDLDALSSAKVDLLTLAKKVNTNINAMTDLSKESEKIRGLAQELIKNSKDKGSTSSSGRSSGNSGSYRFIPTPAPTPLEPQSPDASSDDLAGFTDLDNFAWAKDDILDLYALGIINGDGNGLYAPERLVTREEFIKLIILSLGLATDDQQLLPFNDCDIDQWYYPYVEIAYTKDIIEGITDTTFGVGEFITRQDAAVILDRAISVKTGIKNVGGDVQSYIDCAEIMEYARESIAKMSALNIMTGYPDETFVPNAGTTRAEAAVIIMRLCRYLKEVGI